MTISANAIIEDCVLVYKTLNSILSHFMINLKLICFGLLVCFRLCLHL